MEIVTQISTEITLYTLLNNGSFFFLWQWQGGIFHCRGVIAVCLSSPFLMVADK